MNNETPNFLKPAKPQECEDHAMWQKHLAIAHYILLGLGLILVIFTDRTGAGFLFLLGALGIFGLSIHLGTRHAKWHLKNDIEGRHNSKR